MASRAVSSDRLAAQVCEEFRVTDGAAMRGKSGIDPFIEEVSGLLEEPGRHHRLQTLIDAPADFSSPGRSIAKIRTALAGRPSRCRCWCSLSVFPER